MSRNFIKYLFIVFLFVSCTKREADKLFVEHKAFETGIDFSNDLKNTPELNILNYLYYYNGAGVAAEDFNGDGLVDLYFSGNQIADELYINQGHWKFKKTTTTSGIKNDTGWTTGVTHGDINNDGLVDLYVCKASGYRNLKGTNLLYINQGNNEKGIPYFKEEAKKFGLDFSGLSTQAAFFDYDLDGDLDMYLMNHSVHPNRTYGRGSLRKVYDSISGDILFENKNGHFIDVSETARIFQGKIGYGLGLAIGDLNNDGYPDIYIGNDFFENDYLYINQKNGTFKELISENDSHLGHTTHFSMGNAIGDINNDGLNDILSLDMLPEDLKTYKTSGLEYGYPIYRQYLNKGYSPQFMQNTLHLNLGNNTFTEIAHLSGISATEWSWGALLADFDNDGFKDVFVSNGIKGATNDMDFMNFIANEDIQRRIDKGMKKEDMPLSEEIPEKKVPNYFFKNNGDLTFSNVTESWFSSKQSFSNGCVYADLDNDGDLDIVVNNVNETATLLENTSKGNNWVKIDFEGSQNNTKGVGTKVSIYNNGKKQYAEHFTTGGYLSSIPSTLHFGVGKDSILDSLRVIWPDGNTELKRKIKSNQVTTLSHKDSKPLDISESNSKKTSSYTLVDSLIPFKHRENISIDFDREPLIPFASSNQGPCISVGDINKDGLDDIFIGGAKRQPSELYVQNSKGEFESVQKNLFLKTALNEDTASLFFDANNDGFLDLVVASGGNEFKNGPAIIPRFYSNQNGIFEHRSDQFTSIEGNISKVDTVDYDLDGDLDLLLVSDGISSSFGATPKHYFLENDGNGEFREKTSQVIPEIQSFGSIKDFVFEDLNGDNIKDLIVVGHWAPISIFINTGSKFVQDVTSKNLKNTNGLWNSIKVSDFDNDGDLDFICGNWGSNTKLKASTEYPVTLYRNDFDENGTIDPIITHYHQETETPFASKDELVKQLPYLNKTFLSYTSFANASIEELFGDKNLKNAKKKYVYELRSCYFENKGDMVFEKKPLPLLAQASQINDFQIIDYNKDGFEDLLIVGNNYEISTQLGRLDSFHGLFLRNDKNGVFTWDKSQITNIEGAARTSKEIEIKGNKGYIIGRNNDTPIFLSKNEN